MPRIKVVGYMNTDDMDPEHVDLDNEMGLSEDGYIFYADQLPMEDMEMKLER